MGVALTEADSKSGRRALQFTRAGRKLGAASEAGFAAIAHAVRAVREARTQQSVIVATTPSLASLWLVPRLPDLEARHPRLELSMPPESSSTG